MESMRPDSADPFHYFTRLMYDDNKVGVPGGSSERVEICLWWGGGPLNAPPSESLCAASR